MNPSRFAPLCLAALLSWPACHSDSPKSTTETGQRLVSNVRVFGSLRELMHENRLESRVALKDVVTESTIGLGALSDLRGEISILGGEQWISYPDGRESTRTSIGTSEEAALLVTSNVREWVVIPMPETISLEKLGDFVESEAAQRGLDTKAALPFQIVGTVEQLQWHVIDGSRLSEARSSGHQSHLESSVRGALSNAPAELVGFYSKHHQGVFTHHASTTHVHIIDRENHRTGHVDSAVVSKGAVLKLPSQW